MSTTQIAVCASPESQTLDARTILKVRILLKCMASGMLTKKEAWRSEALLQNVFGCLEACSYCCLPAKLCHVVSPRIISVTVTDRDP